MSVIYQGGKLVDTGLKYKIAKKGKSRHMLKKYFILLHSDGIPCECHAILLSLQLSNINQICDSSGLQLTS